MSHNPETPGPATAKRHIDRVRGAIGYEEAVRRLLAQATALPAETCPLALASGRVLARDVRSPMDLPSFDHAAMDGYALSAGTGIASGAEFDVLASQAAGDGPRQIDSGGCEIMTGARMPEGVDAVIPVEQTQLLASNNDGSPARIRVLQEVRTGQNVRLAGSDIANGANAIAAGTCIDAATTMLLAALGQAHVDVVRQPRVAIICTGKELQADATQPLDADRIHASNGPYLASALAAAGARVTACLTVDDTAVTFADALRGVLRDGVDLVISTGAVSMGRYDFIPELLRESGAELLFHGVAMRPGKPLLCARLANGPLLLAMPGTPMAVAVAMRFFVNPLLRAMLGQAPETTVPAALTTAQSPKPGLRHFLRGQLHVDDNGCLQATPLPQQQPFRIHAFAQADAWIILDGESAECPVGTMVAIASLVAGVPMQIARTRSANARAGEPA
ncbi:molybdopterin molybdotransferase MoeA [Solilutibacter silvestris]|uniref:Molybdopterin molybdenumtransferase n=1 Tax=Solilutibacter silvestris TaxID=1645665 RepID=A0A2K1Q3D8_9GAMM|nr:gephyrin-like molybdotransferase Glp [Lysobacter silvestris]PNS09477.1 Molybdopterin biosynthesis enzyme [Lysobacter silvestris]